MQTKTTQAVALFTSGNLAGALKIFSTFRIGFSKDEQRKLQIAHESLTGKDSFYKSIQVDTDTIKVEAIQLIKSKYNL